MQWTDAHDSAQWNVFVEAHPESNFLQSWQWGEFHISRGKKIVRRILIDAGEVLAVYVGVVETAKRGTHISLAGGPILDWKNKKITRSFRDDLWNEAKKNNCVFARVRPQLELTDDSLTLFRSLGFSRAPMYLSVEHAGILDITKTEQEIISGTRERLRRALKKAAKNDISVEVSTDPEAIHEFYMIQLQTARRHDFVSFSESFLRKQFAAFVATGNAALYTARHNNEILAQNFMIFYGNEASYHYGVSTELGTRLSGAPLLHIRAMQDARERGIKRYNFWGIVDDDDIKHRFYGVSVFKRGFGVQDLKYTPAHDLVVRKIPYLLTWIIETTRRKIRHV